MAEAKTRAAARAAARNPRKAASFPLHDSVGYQVRMTHRQFTQRLALLLAPHDISIGMWYFLRALWEQDGLTQRELAQRVGLEAPAVVEQLRNMEQRGLIARQRSTDDRRKVHIYMTAEARALKSRLQRYARQVVQSALLGFSGSEAKALLGMLRRLQHNLVAAAPAVRAAGKLARR